jgi:hypothetical protein
MALRVYGVNLGCRILTLGRLPMIWILLGELSLHRKVRLGARGLRILVGRLVVFIIIKDVSFHAQTV